MGSSECRVSQPSQYRQKKKQNHPILGEIILTQVLQSGSFLTIKHAKMSNIQGYSKLYDIGSSISLEKNKDYKSKKKYLSIRQLILNHSVFSILPGIKNQEVATVVFDCVQVSLQSIQQSKLFNKFEENHLINIMVCVLDGINILQNHKMGVYPISKKSVIMATNHDQYRGENLAQAIFKVIPLQVVQLETIKKNQLNGNNFVQFYDSKSVLQIQYTPNKHIYCLGILLLDLIFDQNKSKRPQRRQNLDYSFGIKQLSQKKGYDPNTEKIQVLQKSSFSKTFIKVLKLMVEQKQDNRIGFTCLQDACKILKNRDAKQFQQYLAFVNDSFDNVAKKENFPSSRTIIKISKPKRSISSLGLAHKHLEINSIGKLAINTAKPITNQQFYDITNINRKKQKNDQIIFKQCKSQVLRKKNHPNKSTERIEIKLERKCQKKIEQFKQSKDKKNYKKIMFHNGAFYEGQLDNVNNFNGFGTLYYSQKEICYTGYWKDNHFHGFGYLFNQKLNKSRYKSQITKHIQINYKDFSKIDEKGLIQSLWEHYEGEFNLDYKQGYGRIYFQDGSRFEGQFVKNKMHGTGTFVMSNGKFINGIWKNNKLVKEYQ